MGTVRLHSDLLVMSDALMLRPGRKALHNLLRLFKKRKEKETEIIWY